MVELGFKPGSPESEPLPTLVHPTQVCVLVLELLLQEGNTWNTAQPPDPFQPPNPFHSQALCCPTPYPWRLLRLTATTAAPFPENLCRKQGKALIWPASPPPGFLTLGSLGYKYGDHALYSHSAPFIWGAPGCWEAN